MYLRCSVVVLALLAMPLARAGLLFSETFNYANGSLVAVSGGTWATHSGTAGQVDVLAGRADLQVSESEDVSILLPGQPYPAATNLSLYASFTLNYSVLPSAGGAYFVHFKGTGTSNFRAKVFALTRDADEGQYRLGIANSAGSTASATNAASLELNTDYRVYVRYVVSSGVATLWVDPAAEASPSVTGADATSGATLTSLALRQDTGIGGLAVDDLRWGRASRRFMPRRRSCRPG